MKPLDIFLNESVVLKEGSLTNYIINESAAPFSDKHHKTDEIVAMVNEMKDEIIKAKGENGLIKVPINYSINGHGFQPFGNYGKDAYRDFTISIGDKKWKGLTKLDLINISKRLKIDGYEPMMDDLRTEMYEWSPTMEVIRAFFKYGEPCDEFKELAELVKSKYGITLGKKDLYFATKAINSDKEYTDRFYLAYAPYRSKDVTKTIRSFGDKETTCEIVTIDDKDYSYGQYRAIRRAVTLKITCPQDNIVEIPFI